MRITLTEEWSCVKLKKNRAFARLLEEAFLPVLERRYPPEWVFGRHAERTCSFALWARYVTCFECDFFVHHRSSALGDRPLVLVLSPQMNHARSQFMQAL